MKQDHAGAGLARLKEQVRPDCFWAMHTLGWPVSPPSNMRALKTPNQCPAILIAVDFCSAKNDLPKADDGEGQLTQQDSSSKGSAATLLPPTEINIVPAAGGIMKLSPSFREE